MSISFVAFAGSDVGSQNVGAVTPLYALASSLALLSTYGIGRVPLVAGHAMQGGAAFGTTPRVSVLANAIAGHIAQGLVPAVLGAASSIGITPSVALGFAATPFIVGEGAGSAFYPGIQADSTAPTVRSFALDVAANAGLSTIPTVIGAAAQITPLTNWAMLVQSAGYLAIGSTETALTQALSDNVLTSDSTLPDVIQALLDLFTASDTYARQAQVLAALVDGLSLSDVAQMIWQADLLDSFIASAVGNGMAQLTVMLAEAIDFSDGASALSTVLAAIRDGFYVTLTLRDGDDVYTAWVMTPENRAMRSYSSWPFNSIATIGGQLFGAADDGLYLLGGDTDAGQAILASIRTGRLSLGNTRLKRIDRAYIGANTAGNLLLKVEATTIAGDRLQQVYRMTPAVTYEPREHRVDVGRGFRSVYWTFELANDVDGADFELHDMQVLPLTLSGRTF